jgi:hypothetical protein
MRLLIWLGVCVSCATSPEAPRSSATFSGSPGVHWSHAQSGFISYGAPYHRWLVSVTAADGCAAEPAAQVEVTTLSGTTDLPLGTFPMRTAEATILALPSAYVRYMSAPVISGSVTIESASAEFVAGSWTAQVMIGGSPTELGGTFGAPVCAPP